MPVLKRPLKRPSAPEAKASKISISKHDGFLIASLKQYVGRLPPGQRKVLEANISRPDGISLASACTGSGMPEAVHSCVHRLFGKPARVLYACEKMGWKREFYKHTVVPHLHEKSGCIFEDICDLPNGVGKCDSHGQSCFVPDVAPNFFVCGFSCKDFSKLSSSFVGHEKASVLSGNRGTTGNTFNAMAAHIKRTLPACVVLENVADLDMSDDDGVAPNMDFLYELLEVCGYVLNHNLFWSSTFGLPQRRKRIFVVGLHKSTFDLSTVSAQSLLREVLDITAKLQHPMWSLDKFLLDESHPRVQSEMTRAMEATSDMGVGVGEWPSFHREFLRSKGLNYQDIHAPREMLDNRWFDLLPRRSKQCVMVVL